VKQDALHMDLGTPLHVAAWNGKPNVIKYLVEVANAAKDHQDKDGETSLHHAVRNEQVEVVRLLIELKVDLTIKNYDSKTALTLALERPRTDPMTKIVELLEVPTRESLAQLQPSSAEAETTDKNNDTTTTTTTTTIAPQP